jgi:hypothetical protein
VGHCSNGLKDGRGYLIFTKGEKIEGEFKNGKLISGTLIRANGNKYEGEFKNSKYDGKGILTKVNGKRCVTLCSVHILTHYIDMKENLRMEAEMAKGYLLSLMEVNMKANLRTESMTDVGSITT